MNSQSARWFFYKEKKGSKLADRFPSPFNIVKTRKLSCKMMIKIWEIYRVEEKLLYRRLYRNNIKFKKTFSLFRKRLSSEQNIVSNTFK